MQRLEVSSAVRLIYRSLGVKGLNETTAGDETWAVLQIHHPYLPPNACFDQNLMVIVAWDVQGGFNVMPYQKVEWNERYYVISTQPGREKCPEVVENNVIVHNKVTAHSANTIQNVV